MTPGERIAQWPEWKRQASDAWAWALKEQARIIRERLEHIRKYGEQ